VKKNWVNQSFDQIIEKLNKGFTYFSFGVKCLFNILHFLNLLIQYKLSEAIGSP